MRFRGRRELALVALLVVEANRVVASERLVEDLWGDTAPAGAVRSLRVYVSRIRQAFGDPGELLVTCPGDTCFGRRRKPLMPSASKPGFTRAVSRRPPATRGDHSGRTGGCGGPGPGRRGGRPSAAAEAARLEDAMTMRRLRGGTGAAGSGVEPQGMGRLRNALPALPTVLAAVYVLAFFALILTALLAALLHSAPSD